MTDKNPDPTHIRLAKRVAEQLNCSRSTAEQFIEGGFVSVDGQVVEAPGARVRPDQAVTVATADHRNALTTAAAPTARAHLVLPRSGPKATARHRVALRSGPQRPHL